MGSFVSVKVYNELEKRVSDLEASVRALEAYGDPGLVNKPDPAAKIPSIENAVNEEAPADPLDVQFGVKIAELLREEGYHSPAEVGEAVAAGRDLTEISGIGAATFKTIQESLGVS